MRVCHLLLAACATAMILAIMGSAGCTSSYGAVNDAAVNDAADVPAASDAFVDTLATGSADASSDPAAADVGSIDVLPEAPFTVDSGLCVADLSNVGAGDFHIYFSVQTEDPNWVNIVNQQGVCGQYTIFWGVALLQTTGNLQLGVGDGSGVAELQGIKNLDDGVTHDVVISRLAGLLAFTIDGQLDNSQANFTTPIGSVAMLQIGASVCDGPNPSGTTIANVCLTRQ